MRFVDKNVIVVPGSIQILYADKLFDHKCFKIEKSKIGENLLVFPAHSSSTTQSFYEFDNLKL
jgi:hypothetical protein